jgi:hypothetical protein
MQPVDPTRSLSYEQLEQRLETYNNQQRLMGWVLLPGSAFLWIVTFVVLMYLFGIVLGCMGLDGTYALVPTLLCIVALAAYGVRNAAQIRRHEGDWLVDQLGGSSLFESEGFGIARSRVGGAAIQLAVFVEILLCAPRTAVLAIQALRSPLVCDEVVLRQAHAIRQQLFEHRSLQRWMPLAHFEQTPQSVVLLHRLKLIVIDEKDKLVRLES